MGDENLINLEAPQSRAQRALAYGAGVADGGACRRRGGAISTLRLVAINDDYSAGYRAGYFLRDR